MEFEAKAWKATLHGVEVLVRDTASGGYSMQVALDGLTHCRPLGYLELLAAQRQAYEFALRFAELYARAEDTPRVAFEALVWEEITAPPQSPLTR